MSKSTEYTVRPLSRLANEKLEDAFRIYISPTACLQHQLNAGDLCRLWKLGDCVGDAIVWPAPEKLQGYVAQTSKTLQKAYSLSLGDKILLTKQEGDVQVLGNVQLREVNRDGSSESPEEEPHWQWYVRHLLGESLGFRCSSGYG